MRNLNRRDDDVDSDNNNDYDHILDERRNSRSYHAPDDSYLSTSIFSWSFLPLVSIVKGV